MDFKKIIVAGCTCSLLLQPMSTFAKESTLISGEEAAKMLLEHRQEALYQRMPEKASGEKLPQKFDLRDKGVVTPVKFQNPFGTCWGFAAIAAAETSILSELGKTYKDTKLDLSEHHLAYFARTALKDGSNQEGEGYYAPKDKIFDTGGTQFLASTIFASGIGVVDEDTIPYRGLKSKTISDEDGNNFCYSQEDDWTIPEEYRFLQMYELEESNVLPSPAVYKNTINELDAENWDRFVGYVGYDESATEKIKKELINGRAVSIAFRADQSMPGVESTAMFISADGNNWLHYTFDGAQPNHAVTIVGYDDSIPASKFLDHTKDKYGDGEAHQPEGDGAWIVKNSWGASTEDFPNKNEWGNVDENGEYTGYFYLSYYDRSISMPESFDFDVSGVKEAYSVQQYDYLPTEEVSGWVDDVELKMANIFTSDVKGLIRNVSCETANPNTDVTYEVYIMKDNDQVPTDGELVATEKASYEYAGYHRLALSLPIGVKKGQRYAVVVTQKMSYEGKDYYGISSNSAMNKLGMDTQNRAIFEDCDGKEEAFEQQKLDFYAKAVVNAGESMVYIGALKGWADLSSVVPEYQKYEDFRFSDFDNFSIKSYVSIDDAKDVDDQLELPPLNYAKPAKAKK